MGTYVKIELPSLHKKQINSGFKLIKEIEMSLSSYNPRAKVYQLNQHKTIQADEHLTNTIKKSIKFYALTEGYFDITIGSLTKKLYHFGEHEKLPLSEEIQDAIIDINSITFKEKNISIKPNITIDLGGIGKGYAVDKVANYYNEHNISKGKIALSGDIRCINICNFLIQSPFKKKQTLFTLKSKIPHLSISTSGTYRRYIKEKKNHHLINPKTKKPSRTFISVTLFTTSNNTKIDALATAIGAMNQQEALALLKKEKNIGYILLNIDRKILYGNLKKFVIIKNKR